MCDNDLAMDVRADAADVLLNLGTKRFKSQARDIIILLGRNGGTVRSVFDNAQNVHHHEIDESAKQIIEFLIGVLLHPKCIGKAFDIGGLSVLTYKEMLYRYSKNRGLKKLIITLPIMTPRLSSYWLYFVTSTSYPLAVNLVKSMKSEVLVKGDKLNEILDVNLYTYDEAIKMAFIKIEQNSIISSWKDSLVSGLINNELKHYIQVPKFGILPVSYTHLTLPTKRIV